VVFLFVIIVRTHPGVFVWPVNFYILQNHLQGGSEK